ncbi:MAG TPA: class I SAM-dependent methyltransferase [Opitutus sp.]|nr:class I SAM-dependent methyltransferase [Opitutus sp.]
MPLIDHLLASPRLKQTIWRFWYPFLTRRLRAEDVLFLNYAFEDPAISPALDPSDEPHRACIQLYHHVATLSGETLSGREVLEVSCGHGGGASYLKRTFRPRHYTGLDLNPAAIAFCRERHRMDGLTFRRGDALQLPFGDHTFDFVLNVEASHCYPTLSVFFAEVARVLRPGGCFLYADFRFRSAIAEWERDLASAPLERLAEREINAEVLRGLDRNSDRSLRLIVRHLPRFLESLGRDFAAVKGSRVYHAVQHRELSYRSYCFRKPLHCAAS